MRPKSEGSARSDILWLLALSALAVGAKNFEEGFSYDAPLYATIARNMARSGDWFWMYGNVTDFIPFADHPHLGFWFVALVFKVLPAADWSARIPGICFYFGFLWLFFVWLRRLSGEKVAIIAVVILWAWARFANFFSNVYMDPACLFFGTAALVLLSDKGDSGNRAFVKAGMCLALSVMAKGLAVLGFLPAVGFLVAKSPQPLKRVSHLLLGFIPVLGLYYLAVQYSSVPDFFEIYWRRQVTERFARSPDVSLLYSGPFWMAILRETYLFAPIALFSLTKLKKHRECYLPWILFCSYCVLFAPTQREGNQYLLMLLPWLAWLVAVSVEPYFDAAMLRMVSFRLAFGAFFLIQFVPIRIHGGGPPRETAPLREIFSTKGGKAIVVVPDNSIRFLRSTLYAWYLDREVRYLDDCPSPKHAPGRQVLLAATTDVIDELPKRGWCQLKLHPPTLWVPCLTNPG